MAGFRQYLDALPGDVPLALDRLIGVGVGAHRDGRDAVSRLRQLRAQQARGVGFGEQLRLEIEARGEIVIGVDRAVEADVGLLRVMMVRGCSIVTLVRGRGTSPSISGMASSQSPSSSRWGSWKRVLARDCQDFRVRAGIMVLSIIRYVLSRSSVSEANTRSHTPA
jgi:hypothetical protein